MHEQNGRHFVNNIFLKTFGDPDWKSGTFVLSVFDNNSSLYPPYPKDRGMLWFYSKTTGWIVLKFGIHIGSDSVLAWLTFQRSRSQRQKMMWFFRHFWIFISYHIFLLNQVEGAIAIPPSNSAPLPLFCPSVCPSVCPSIGLLTTFSGFCTFADKSLGRNGIELEMQMFPDDLPLANIDADGYCCHFMRSSVRPTIHGLGFVYCIQSAWKKWPTIWHADVSRWLTLSIHGCLWILLLVCLSVHLSVCSFTAFSGGCAFADKSLGTNGIKFDMMM